MSEGWKRGVLTRKDVCTQLKPFFGISMSFLAFSLSLSFALHISGRCAYICIETVGTHFQKLKRFSFREKQIYLLDVYKLLQNEVFVCNFFVWVL